MGRKPSGKYPPYISLREAIDIISAIHNKMGGSASKDNLSTVFKNTPKSSSFIKKISALRSYGLISEDSYGSFQLSSLAQRIVTPQFPEDRGMAILTSFRNFDLFSTIHDKFKGKILPEEPYLSNGIQHDLSVPASHKSLWSKSFIESGEVAGIFRRDGGKTVVTDGGIGIESPLRGKPLEVGAQPMEGNRMGVSSIAPLEKSQIQGVEPLEEGWEPLQMPDIKIFIRNPDESKIEKAKKMLDLLKD